MTWLTEPLEQRTDILDPSVDYPTIDEQLYARQRAQAGNTGRVTIREALGIPAVWRALTLLSTVTSTFHLREFVNQTEVNAAPVVLRPNRKWRPEAFFKRSVWDMGSRGETIYIVRERDFQDFPSSLTPVIPESMRSDWDGEEHRNWQSNGPDGRIISFAQRDVIHIPLIQDPETGRGMGPLQMCGVAFNVAQQADMWASRFFLGSVPSLYLDSASPINSTDAQTIKEQWLHDPPNVPKVGYGYTPTSISTNMEESQALEARMMSRGDVAVAFGIPGKLLEYTESGSSLTYQNVGDLATELVRLTLGPSYLEPIEQTFSDLRPRGHETRFDTDDFQRADPKTRYEIHKTAIETGIYTAEYAADKEQIIDGGTSEVQPIPLREVG